MPCPGHQILWSAQRRGRPVRRIQSWWQKCFGSVWEKKIPRLNFAGYVCVCLCPKPFPNCVSCHKAWFCATGQGQVVTGVVAGSNKEALEEERRQAPACLWGVVHLLPERVRVLWVGWSGGYPTTSPRLGLIPACHPNLI